MEAKNAEIFNEIENIARTVAHGYPITAERYQAERVSERKFGDCPPGDPLYKFCQEQAATSQRHLLTTESVCAEWREKLSRLAILVARHLPEFDGTLRHVVFAPQWWEQKPLAEWESLLIELGRIEAAVIRAAEPTAESDKSRLSVDREKAEITFDGVSYPVDDPDALTLFAGMIATYPGPFHATKQEAELRPSRINTRLNRGRTKPLRNEEAGGTIWTAGRGQGGCRLLIDPR